MKTCEAIETLFRIKQQIEALKTGWKTTETTAKVLDGMLLDVEAVKRMAAQQHAAELQETEQYLQRLRTVGAI
jgi:hypothetical protein